MKRNVCLLLIIIIATIADAAHAADVEMDVYWNDGLRMKSPDNQFKLKIGGRLMNDWAFFSEESAIDNKFGELEDSTEFRRARLYFAGTLYGWIRFKAQYEFAGGKAHLKDGYIAFTQIPVVGEIKVGHFKEPFGLEALTSSKYFTFMERGLPDAFAPGRNTGIGFHNHFLDDRLTAAAGVFKETDGYGNGGGDGKYGYTARLTVLPVYANDGSTLVHIGGAYSYRLPDSDTVRFSERPEAHLAPAFVDTGDIDSDAFNLIGAELAAVFGPLSIQGEYIHAVVARKHASEIELYGYYCQASYFLTGEHRAYNPKSGAFKRVKPKSDFHPGKSGPGAWELAARYSFIDMSDGGVDGGIMGDITGGVNWHINPNLRIMLNYVFADLNGVGEQSVLQTRLQLDF